MQNIRAICFDLDNTLWDLDPVIPRAERRLYSWFEDYYPRVPQRFAPETIPELRLRMLRDNPGLRHDLTELRLKTLRYIAAEAGYDAAMADEAFRVFQTERNAVELYDDVLPVLEHFVTSHTLLALTNGNADLDAIGIRHYFVTLFTAREIGAAKPDARVYEVLCAESGLRPEQILHVGDDPENDIVAAARAGLRTVWINRRQQQWEHSEGEPDYVATDLLQLKELFARD